MIDKDKLYFDLLKGYFDLNEYSCSFGDYSELLYFLNNQHIIKPISYMRMHDSMCESIVFLGNWCDVSFINKQHEEVHCRNFQAMAVSVLMDKTAYISIGQAPLALSSHYYNIAYADWVAFSCKWKGVPEPEE